MARTFKPIVISDFSGGLNTKDAPHLIGDNESAILQNFEISGKGRLKKRFGFDKVSTGGSTTKGVRGLLAFQSIGANPEKFLLIFNDSKLFTVSDTDTTWIDHGTYGTDDGERVNGTVYKNLGIFGNGNDANNVKKFADVEEQSDTTGGNTDTIATAISEVATEKKTFTAITSGFFITSIEIEISAKGTGDWTVTVHDSSDVVIASDTILAANMASSGFQKFNMNFTAGSEDHFHVTSTVADGIAVSSGANDLETVSYKVNAFQIDDLGGTPPNASIFETHRDFVFASGITTAPTVVFNCVVEDPEDWTGATSGNTPILLDNGERMTAMKSHDQQFLMIKERSKAALEAIFKSSITVVADADTLGWRQSEITDRSDGAVSGNTAQAVNAGVMFLGENRFQSFGFVEDFPGFRRPANLSEKIDPTVRLINDSALDKPTAIHDRFQNKYRCAVPLATSPDNSHELVYDLRFGAWSVNTGLQISDYAIFENSDGREVYFGSELSGKLFRFNRRFSDNFDESTGVGKEIDAIWRGKTYRAGNSNLGEANRFKRVTIKGFITNPFSGTFTIVVGNQSAVVSQDATINDTNIIGTSAVGEYVGDDFVGIGFVGDAGSVMDDIPMFRFFKEIHVDSDINEGQEIFLAMRSSNVEQGIEIEEIIIEGERMSEAILTPSL